jgi:hypothetical protein
MTNQERNAAGLAEFRTLVDWVLIQCQHIDESTWFEYGDCPQWWYASRALRDTALNCKKQLPKVEATA